MFESGKLNASQSHVAALASISSGSMNVCTQLLSLYGRPMTKKSHPISGTMQNGECYKNATLSSTATLKYCEGYATAWGIEFLPLEHGWLVDSTDGLVVDPTWKRGSNYFGIEFDSDFVYEVTERIGYYGIMCNLYRLRMSPQEAFEYIERGIVK